MHYHVDSSFGHEAAWYICNLQNSQADGGSSWLLQAEMLFENSVPHRGQGIPDMMPVLLKPSANTP